MNQYIIHPSIHPPPTLNTTFATQKIISHITVHGIGTQQHSYPSHSIHFVFPAVPPSGLTTDEIVDAAAEPGPLRFTSEVGAEEHILCWSLGVAVRRRRLVSEWPIDRFGVLVGLEEGSVLCCSRGEW